MQIYATLGSIDHNLSLCDPIDESFLHLGFIIFKVRYHLDKKLVAYINSEFTIQISNSGLSA